MYQSKMKLIEINDPEQIIAKSYESVPLVLVGKKKVYFSGDELDSGLNRLREVLEERLLLTKEHNCANCGNCKCPADSGTFETAVDPTELGNAI